MEWTIADMAILGSQAISVPIYPSSSVEDVGHIIRNSGVRVLFIETADHLDVLERALGPTLPEIQNLICLDPSLVRRTHPKVHALGLRELEQLGVHSEALAGFENRLEALKSEDYYTIVYTSGTTGVPKGVILTHENIMSVLSDCVRTFGDTIHPSKEVLLSTLPYAHIMGRLESLASFVYGWTLAFGGGFETLMTDLKIVQPTLLFTVPRFFEKSLQRIRTAIEEASPIERLLIDQAYELAKEAQRKHAHGKEASWTERTILNLARKTIFSKILEAFGGKLRFAICGGAPLSEELGLEFERFGILILEGYGLTETAAPVALNTPLAYRFGAVGKPLSEVALRIAEDGEILIRSKKVSPGYWGETPRPKDEWFATGDLGVLDSDGYLRIVDRKKDLLITSGAKNIAPQKIENLARGLPLLHQIVVLGDRKPYLVALLTLDREETLRFAKSEGVLFSEWKELIHHPRVLQRVRTSIHELNTKLASYETLKRFAILPTDFSVETGELTPTLKPKRRVILERYREEIEALYSEKAT
jgi:long-chain acyl-CoA synthetase